MKKAEETLEFVDLLALKDAPAGDLTLANQKRLEVARALASGSGNCCCWTNSWPVLLSPEIDEAMKDIQQIRSAASP